MDKNKKDYKYDIDYYEIKTNELREMIIKLDDLIKDEKSK